MEGIIIPEIQIHVPIWRHPLFLAGTTISILAIVYALYTMRIRQIRKEEQLQTEFNKKLADVEMSALRAQMNPHFMFNSLNSIKTYILKQRTHEASIYLTKFSQLMRAVLRNSKSSLVSMKDEVQALRLYIELEALRFESEFEYVIQIDPSLELEQTFVPPLLIQPYVENAIRHGLLEKEYGYRLLHVSISLHGKNQVLMTVEDNGVGRAYAQQKKQLRAAGKNSLGMQITKDRIDLLKQTLGISAEVQIQDLKDSQQNAAGTRVEVLIPLFNGESH
jgi:LytS/YehU family sensor histidine kinase